MPGLQGLSRFGQSPNQDFNSVREQAMTGAEEGPINVLATITPDSLTKMMQRMGQGVGTAAQPAQEPSSTVGGGLQKSGDKPINEQTKLLGFNREGNEKMGRIFLPGLWHGIDALLK